MVPVMPVDGSTVESWNDPEIRAYFVDARRLGVPSPISMSIEAHQPEVLRAFGRLWWTTFVGGEIDREVKERLRIEIAELAGCSFCSTSRMIAPEGGAPESSSGEAAALAFGRRFAAAPWEVARTDWEQVEGLLTPAQVAELALFCAWQYGGPRTIRSWGADQVKADRAARGEALATRLAYENETELIEPPPAVAAVDDVEGEIAAADAKGLAPRAWLELLAPRPPLLSAWLGLYRATVFGSTLPRRIGQLVRADLARLLVCPDWIPGGIQNLPALEGITLEQLAALDPNRLAQPERVALRYVRGIAQDLPAEQLATEDLARTFTPAQRVELGFAVAAQLGPILLMRSRHGASALAAEGTLLNGSTVEYRVPRAADIPPATPILAERPDGVGAYGAKGAGEGSLNPVAAAITNAVWRAAGIRLREAPFTPERIWRALRERDRLAGRVGPTEPPRSE